MEREGRGRVTIKRRVGERLIIGDGDSQVIVEIMPPRGQGARLRVDAPLELEVRREEIAPRSERAA